MLAALKIANIAIPAAGNPKCQCAWVRVAGDQAPTACWMPKSTVALHNSPSLSSLRRASHRSLQPPYRTISGKIKKKVN